MAEPMSVEDYVDRIEHVENKINSLEIPSDILPSKVSSYKTSLIKKKKFLTYLILFGGNVGRASRVANITRGTVNNSWFKDPGFKAIYDDIQEDFIDIAEEQLNRHIRLGNLTATTFMLKTKGRKRGYGDNVKVEHDISEFGASILAARERAKQSLLEKRNAIQVGETEGVSTCSGVGEGQNVIDVEVSGQENDSA